MPYTIIKPQIIKDYKYKGCYILKVRDCYTQEELYLVPEIIKIRAFNTLADTKFFIRHFRAFYEDRNSQIIPYVDIKPEPVEELFQNFLDQKWNEIESKFIRDHEHEMGITEEGYPTRRQNELDNLLIQFSQKHPTWQNKVISSK